MKIGKTKLRMSDGSVRKFKGKKARDNFEAVARAVKDSEAFKKKLKNKRKKK